MTSLMEVKGFNEISYDELMDVNGGYGSSCGSTTASSDEVMAGLDMVGLGGVAATGAVAAASATLAGVIAAVGLGAAAISLVAMGVDMIEGNGLDHTQAVINSALRK